MQLAQRLARQSMHFERTLNTLRIVRLDAARGLRIERRELGVQRRPAALRGLGIDRSSHSRIRLRHIRESTAQCTEIEHRAADQQRQLAAGTDVVDRAPRVAHELPGRVRLQRIENVDEVMRMPAQHLARRLAGADVHAAIDHRRIDADDLQVVPLRQAQREIRLAGAGRPEDQRNRRRAAPGRGAHRPRRNIRSRSPRLTYVQVGRP